MIKQHPLIILSPVKKDKLDTLNKRLGVIRESLEKGEETEFKKISTLHYGRWVILSRESFRDEPAVPVGVRLIFSTNFDGDEESHLDELVTVLTKYIDDIYECCEGYPEPGARTTESRKNYLKKYCIKTSAFFNGAPGRSVSQIHQEESLRQYIWEYIAKNKWDGKSAVEVHRAIRKEIDSKPEFEWSKHKAQLQRMTLPTLITLTGYGILLSVLFFSAWIILFAFFGSFTSLFTFLGGFNSVLLLLILLFFGIIQLWTLYIYIFHERRDENGTLTLSQLDDNKVNELKKVEDLFPQNQFTQVAVLKPGTVRHINFRIWMLRTSVLASKVFVHGRLLNIPTIHFARWVLFDNNKHVLFFSNFDGNWQQYLGDFIDQSGWGLTGIFSNTVNFPKTKFMVTGGAYDEEHFLAWSRSTQVPTQVWYCPYPHLSIKNVNNNTKIRNELWRDLNEEQAKMFLKRF
jgi:hypothetical protein